MFLHALFVHIESRKDGVPETRPRTTAAGDRCTMEVPAPDTGVYPDMLAFRT